jgi:hypothetical protein
MAAPEYHRRRLAAWSRALLAVPFVALLLGEYLHATRDGHPDLFLGGLALVAFLGAWAGLAAVWHYAVLDGADA